MNDQPPSSPHLDVEDALRRIESHVAASEYQYRGEIVVKSDDLLHFIALLRLATRRPSSS